MLSEAAFSTWCQHLGLAPEVHQQIAAIRTSPPDRKVRGRVGNVTGRYPSPKMGHTIQFESQHVELWAIYAMERDDDVLEYYDQPAQIPLTYRAKSGRQTTQWHHADFFVLRQHSAGYEEWKPESALEDLGFTMPGRYVRGSTGVWECPPGMAYAHPFGLTYRVRTSSEYHPHYIENMRFLQDYWAHPVAWDAVQERLAVTQVTSTPGIPLPDLLQLHATLSVDLIWALLAMRHLFTDFTATALMRHEQVLLYPSEVSVIDAVTAPARHQPSSALIWQKRLWLWERAGEQVVLQPEFGEPYSMAAHHFQDLMQTGEIRVMTATDPAPTTPAVRQMLNRAGPKTQREANRRMEQVLAYLAHEPLQTSKRTVQRWYAAYQEAEKLYDGAGYLGLLDHIAERGNHTLRAPEAAKQLLTDMLTQHYAAPQAKRGAAVYALYRNACEQQGIPPVTQRTFYRELQRFTTHEITSKRHGRRAAYSTQPFFWTLDQMTPRHGERPWAIAHLDHTQLDIELVSSMTGKSLGRPWATLLLDAYSRRILAIYVSYDEPSYRSAMMVLRRCVQRHQRLPQDLVVDQGTDFESVYFETLLARYFITKKERPAHQPRFGSVIERVFGTATTEFLNQLLGNTQASKIPRQMSREVNPKQLAVWTLERFTSRFEEWCYDIYDHMDHPMLGQSPAEAFDQGIRQAGARLHRVIPYDEEFRMMTRPSTRTGQAHIHATQGVTINRIQYWHPTFRSPGVAGRNVPVRYEPFDMGFAYAFIGGQWLECAANTFALVHGRTEREWRLILEEWRQQQRTHERQRAHLTAKILAPFLEAVSAEEHILLQQQRDQEAQPMREVIAGMSSLPLAPPVPVTIEEDAPLDYTAILAYEEYR